MERFIDDSFRGFIEDQTTHVQDKRISILQGAIRGRCREPARHSTPELGGRHTRSQGSFGNCSMYNQKFWRENGHNDSEINAKSQASGKSFPGSMVLSLVWLYFLFS